MREELPGRPCSVAAALNLVGEKWALLAVREIAFGNKRFDAIARNTGAPRDRLAARLRALEAGGVVERRQYSEHPPRYEYELTEAGLELRSVLIALRSWGTTGRDAPCRDRTPTTRRTRRLSDRASRTRVWRPARAAPWAGSRPEGRGS